MVFYYFILSMISKCNDVCVQVSCVATKNLTLVPFTALRREFFFHAWTPQPKITVLFSRFKPKVRAAITCFKSLGLLPCFLFDFGPKRFFWIKKEADEFLPRAGSKWSSAWSSCNRPSNNCRTLVRWKPENGVSKCCEARQMEKNMHHWSNLSHKTVGFLNISSNLSNLSS